MKKTFIVTIADDVENSGSGCVVLLGILCSLLIISTVGMAFLMLLSVGARL